MSDNYVDFDFQLGNWPFGITTVDLSEEIDSDEHVGVEVPLPSGFSCLRINTLLTRAEVNAGEFTFGGPAEMLPSVPGLVVKNVGSIPFPVRDEIADKLIAVCEKSPFGRKLETLTDETVRKSWQLQPDQVELQNPMWQRGIDELTKEIADRLGYKEVPLQCVLYKLLVYGEGGHFAKHKDTEKEDGMIATLVIQPPSSHEGGDLVVYRDTSAQYRHDFGKKDGMASYISHYAVHYADAEHALEEVTKGYRLALVYSICLPPTMPDTRQDDKYQPLLEDLASAISDMGPGDDSFALLLSHQYTEKSIGELGSGALKGVDRARFCALEEANAIAPADKKLYFFIAKLSHKVDVFGDDFGNHSEFVTWFSTGGKSVGEVNKAAMTFNFLNPAEETLSHFWSPYGTTTYEGNVGNESATRKTTYSRYAIAAFYAERGTVNVPDNGIVVAQRAGMTGFSGRLYGVVSLRSGNINVELLNSVVEQAAACDDTELCSSSSLGLLWNLAIRCGDKDIFARVANRFNQVDARLLRRVIEEFSKYTPKGDETGAGEIPEELTDIVNHRIKWLDHNIRTLKNLSLEMPSAFFPEDTDVQNFLRGPDVSMNTMGLRRFNNIQEARDYAGKCLRKPNINATFKVEVGGTDDNIFVTITKTKAWVSKNQELLSKYKAERTALLERYT